MEIKKIIVEKTKQIKKKVF